MLTIVNIIISTPVAVKLLVTQLITLLMHNDMCSREKFLCCVISNAATKVVLTCFMTFKPSYGNLSVFTKPL